jgi:hypothetical protein
LLTDHCSGAFLDRIARSAVLAIVLGVTVMLATGCSATGNGFNARIISPVTTNQKTPDPEENDWYQPERSPAFSDLFGS